MIRKFSHAIMSIFFDMAIYGEEPKNIYSPQDLTEHYKKEIAWCELDWIYIAAHYKDISYSIESYKYRSDRQYVWKYVDLLSKIIDHYWILVWNENVVVMSVPMHWSRYMIRGFNHIDLLTSALIRKTGLSQIKPIRAFFTRRQSKLSKIWRIKNREWAFALKSAIPLPKYVILVDDIISTGSTANACAKILKSAGVEKVYGVFLASNQ